MKMTQPIVDIDKSSPIPLYFQAATQIERAIIDGELEVGQRLDNEVALAASLGLSRTTMRRAIQQLVDKGLLVRKRGVGTQVVRGPMHRRVELTSLYDDLRHAGRDPSTQVLQLGIEPASKEAARELNLKPGDGVTKLVRLRSTGDGPLALMVNYLPTDLGIDDADVLTSGGLYDVLRRQGVHLRVAHQRIGATAATAATAELLGQQPGSPLLAMQRTAFDDVGRAIEYGTHVYRPEMYTFDVTLVER
jgi:DNA-binding GntR family transcriptional regulator